jgi:hypothetical protein
MATQLSEKGITIATIKGRVFYPEDGGDTFLRNVGSRNIYTAPQPRRRNFS